MPAKKIDLHAAAQQEAASMQSSSAWWSTLPDDVVAQLVEMAEQGVVLDDGRTVKASPKFLANTLVRAGFKDATPNRLETLLRHKGLR